MYSQFLNAAVTFLVGITAFVVYLVQKHHEAQNAARIIIADVRHAEQVVVAILERGQIDIWSKDLLRENNWAKYKHLLARFLSSDDLVAFNRFFLAAAQMSDALQRMREVHYAALDEKARITQQELTKVIWVDDADYSKKVNEIMNRINRSDPMFQPDEPRSRYFVNLQQMGRLSTTYGFSAMKKLAKDL